jgi:hypothetical protein
MISKVKLASSDEERKSKKELDCCHVGQKKGYKYNAKRCGYNHCSTTK